MSIIKSANARNVLPFPSRKVEPLLLNWRSESNRRQLELRRLRRRAQAVWACVWVVSAVIAVWMGMVDCTMTRYPKEATVFRVSTQACSSCGGSDVEVTLLGDGDGGLAPWLAPMMCDRYPEWWLD